MTFMCTEQQQSLWTFILAVGALSPWSSQLQDIWMLSPSVALVLLYFLFSIYLRIPIYILSMSFHMVSSLSLPQLAQLRVLESERGAGREAVPEEALVDPHHCLDESQTSPVGNVPEPCPVVCLLVSWSGRLWTHHSKETICGGDLHPSLLLWQRLCVCAPIPPFSLRLCKSKWARLGCWAPAAGNATMAEAQECTAHSCSTGPPKHQSPGGGVENRDGKLNLKPWCWLLGDSAAPHGPSCQLQKERMNVRMDWFKL